MAVPTYEKTPDFKWPDDPLFYLITKNGLFLCRNHPFFRSSCPAKRGPSDLESHESSLALRYPPIPRRLFEKVVGFFSVVADLHGSEAAALFAWDATHKRVRVVVPPQKADVGSTKYSTQVSATGVAYGSGEGIVPADWHVFGDIHSHVTMAAYASDTDKHDEMHRPGIHIVVGKIDGEPPEFHAEVVIDQTRFGIETVELLEEPYLRRDELFPRSWLDRIEIHKFLIKKPKKHKPGHYRGAGPTYPHDDLGRYDEEDAFEEEMERWRSDYGL